MLDRLRYPRRLRKARRPPPVPGRADPRARPQLRDQRARDAHVPLEPPERLDPPGRLRTGRGPGDFAYLSLELLRERHLDLYDVTLGIVEPDEAAAFAVLPNAQLAARLASAYNDWLLEQWLQEEPRLRGMLVVPAQWPEAAAAEIRRLGGRDEFVGVFLPGAARIPYGNPVYDPIWKAAADTGLPSRSTRTSRPSALQGRSPRRECRTTTPSTTRSAAPGCTATSSRSSVTGSSSASPTRASPWSRAGSCRSSASSGASTRTGARAGARCRGAAAGPPSTSGITCASPASRSSRRTTSGSSIRDRVPPAGRHAHVRERLPALGLRRARADAAPAAGRMARSRSMAERGRVLPAPDPGPHDRASPADATADRGRARRGSSGMLEIGGDRVGLSRVGGDCTRSANRCPHQARRFARMVTTPIAYETAGSRSGLRASVVRCPWHKWEFDIATRTLARRREAYEFAAMTSGRGRSTSSSRSTGPSETRRALHDLGEPRADVRDVERPAVATAFAPHLDRLTRAGGAEADRVDVLRRPGRDPVAAAPELLSVTNNPQLKLSSLALVFVASSCAQPSQPPSASRVRLTRTSSFT